MIIQRLVGIRATGQNKVERVKTPGFTERLVTIQVIPQYCNCHRAIDFGVLRQPAFRGSFLTVLLVRPILRHDFFGTIGTTVERPGLTITGVTAS